MKFYQLILFAILGVGIFVVHSCTEGPVIEVGKTSHEIVEVVDIAQESISTADILRDFVLTTAQVYKKEETLLPSSVEITYLDTSFSDGNGIAFLLDFGDLGEDAPHGILCKDGKYRAGLARVELSKPFHEIGADIKASFNEDSPFYAGDGASMKMQHGELHFTRKSDDEILMHCTNLVSAIDDIQKTMRTELLVTTLEESGLGLINDQVSLDGTIELEDSEGVWVLEIEESLIKDYELDCSKYIINGVMSISPPEDISGIRVFFDTDGKQSCDNEIAVEVNGKRVLHRL